MRKEVIYEVKWTGNVVDLNVVPVAALIRSMSRTADKSYARTARRCRKTGRSCGE